MDFGDISLSLSHVPYTFAQAGICIKKELSQIINSTDKSWNCSLLHITAVVSLVLKVTVQYKFLIYSIAISTHQVITDRSVDFLKFCNQEK